MKKRGKCVILHILYTKVIFSKKESPMKGKNRTKKTASKDETALQPLEKPTVKERIKEYLIITFGVFLVAVGVYFFKFPNNISTGGVTGLAVVLAQILPLSASNVVTIFNALFLVIGFIVLGKEFGIKTVYGSTLLSVFLELFDWIPMPAGTLPITVTEANPNGEPMLELLFAVAFPAVGAAILFFNKASTGGTDIVAMIIHKYTSLDSGKALVVADFILVLLTFLNFKDGSVTVNWTTGLLSVSGTILKSLVVDNAIENINQSKYFLVITTKKDEVEKYIIEKLHRGATTWNCVGAYTQKDEYAIVTVMNRYQGFQLRQYIKSIDPESFVIVTNSSDIIGKGFKQV